MLKEQHPYFDKTIVLTSKHQKMSLVSPSFNSFVGSNLVEANLDTDQLGTFTGEVERKYPPLECAIRKARMGMQELGLPIGLASEGSIGPDPSSPFVFSDIEEIVLVDDERELIISERYRSFEIIAVRTEASPKEDLSDFLMRANFPQHQLIVKPTNAEGGNAIKGVSTLSGLQEALYMCARQSTEGLVIIESDLRAHCSPSRQRNISQVAQLLAKRVGELCLECRSPGWGRIRYEKGLSCTLCISWVPEAIAREVNGCSKCTHEKLGKVIAERADPAICPWCNP